MAETDARPELDEFLACPTLVSQDPTCSDLVDMYNTFGMLLRDEIKHLPLGTMQLMLLERTLTNYIMLRWRERKALGSDGAFETTAAIVQFQQFWLSCHKELNSQLKLNDRDYRESYDSKVTSAISKGLAGQPEEVQVPVREALAKEFAAADL